MLALLRLKGKQGPTATGLFGQDQISIPEGALLKNVEMNTAKRLAKRLYHGSHE